MTRARIGTSQTPSLKAYIEQCEQEIARLREALQDTLSDLQIILPMAKGYAHEHPVGSNNDKVYGVDQVIEQAQQALKE